MTLVRSVLATLLVLVLVLSVPQPALGFQSGITSVDLDGQAIATTEDGVQYVWEDEELDVQVTVVDYLDNRNDQSTEETYTIRISEGRNETYLPALDDHVAVQSVTIPEGERRQVTFALDPSVLSNRGLRTLSIGMYPESTGPAPLLSHKRVRVRVIHRNGDLDGDGLANRREIGGETDFRDPDTDEDTVADGVEVFEFGTNPSVTDTDGDGLNDAGEIKLGTNPLTPDTDDDGLSDADEVRTYKTSPFDPDADDDGIGDATEVEEYGTDPLDRDTDGDGLTDPVERKRTNTNPLAADTDDDGLEDEDELSRFETDPTAANSPIAGVSEPGDAKSSPGDRAPVVSTNATSEPGDGTVDRQHSQTEVRERIGSTDTSLHGGETDPLTAFVLVPFGASAAVVAGIRVLRWARYP
ncbi:MAG: hypothetical protein ABEJ58_10890 [Halodesulfurarchaeum sp.]